MGQASPETLTAHCVMTVPVSFTSDDDGYYDDDNRNDGKNNETSASKQTKK